MDKESYEALLDNIQCPLCCLAMLPPLRTPMIIPECGHTICESCISKLKECPFCHHPISKTTRNILVLQIIDTLDHKKLIPEFLNPPPPQENKLIPKIDNYCTFASSGPKYINQRFYCCKTCKIIGNKGICEVCARKCHKGHDVSLKEKSKRSFCDCCKMCHCECIPPKSFPLRCSFEITYGTPIEQPMYQCVDCDITGDYYICQSCAIKCHNSHNLKYFDKVKGKHCQCLNLSCCKISFRKPICTFLQSGTKYIQQPWYHCKTCGLVNGLGCCSVCAHHCHKGHDVEYKGIHEKCYCDCCEKKKCKMLDFDNSSYLVRCTNFNRDHKDRPVKQRMYNCATCGLAGICEACAINCHINHSIQFINESEFCCVCINSNNCIMSLSPLLRNNRSKCDRSVLDVDDVSPCYTCYKCSKSGQLKLCETCALKNHLNHDIHFIGYLSFKCGENERPTKRSISSFRPKIIKI